MTRYSKTMAEALLEVRNPSVDSKMPSSYSKTMGQALDEMYSVNLVEGTIDKIKDIVSKKQHSKIDGVTVDLFTASAISQIYDKVNDANKKKMEKLPITKLAALAMKMMKNEYVPEELDLDEAISGDQYYYVDPNGVVAAVGNKDAMRKMNMKQAKDGNKGGSFSQNLKKYKVGDKIKEEADLDEASKEGTIKIIKNKDGKFQIQKMTKGKFVDIGKPHNSAKEAEKFRSGQPDMFGEQLAKIKGKTPGDKGRKAAVEDDIERAEKKGDKKEVEKLKEADLDEGKMAQMHQMMKDKKSAAQIAKEMGLDVKTVKALMAGYNEEVEIDEHKGDKPHKHPHVDEGAAADARRSIGRDKDLGRKRDSADDDDDADEDDVKAASKNIMMQLRKSVSLRGKFDVEFMDRKKVKVDSKIAQAVAAKYMTLKRPAEKEKFQNKISKSYKDMLNALKENKSPIRETILKRIATKLMERKNG